MGSDLESPTAGGGSGSAAESTSGNASNPARERKWNTVRVVEIARARAEGWLSFAMCLKVRMEFKLDPKQGASLARAPRPLDACPRAAAALPSAPRRALRPATTSLTFAAIPPTGALHAARRGGCALLVRVRARVEAAPADALG